MRRIVMGLLLLLPLVPAPAAQAVDNLVRNSGWESGGQFWTTFNGVVATEGARTGAAAARLSGGEANFEQLVEGLLPSTTYTLSGWARTDSQQVWIGVKRYGGAESNVRITSPAYSRGEVTFTTGPDSRSATIYFYKNTTGNTAYGDDFEIVPTAALGREHAVNGGFESGATGWSQYNSAVVAGAARTGTYAARLSGGESTFEQAIHGLSANTTYVLTGWARTDSQEVWMGVKNYGGMETNQKVTSAAYTKATVTFTTGKDNTSAIIYFYKYSVGNTGFGDDFSVQPAPATLPRLWTENSLVSVFKNSEPSSSAGTGISLVAARNEYEFGQVVLRSVGAFDVEAVRLPELVSGDHRIPVSALRYRYVDYIYLPHHSKDTTGTIGTAPGYFPEYLLNDASRSVPGNTNQAISVTAYIPKDTPAGVYTGTIEVITSAGNRTVPLQVEVANVTLPDSDAAVMNYANYTYMFGFEGVTHDVERIYGLTKYSPAWWNLMEEFAADMREHRINVQWVPTIDLLLDGGSTVSSTGAVDFKWDRFDQVLQFLLDQGVAKRFLSECFLLKPSADRYAVWGLRRSGSTTVPAMLGYDTPEGKAFAAAYLNALREHLKAKGWYDQWSMTLGDEPWSAAHLATWKQVYDEQITVRMPGVKVSTPHFLNPDQMESAFRGRLGIWVPLMPKQQEFASFYRDRQAEGNEVWTYVANFPREDYLNRFIDLPLARLRLMNWYGYGAGVTGTLHWAYNNWHEDQAGWENPGDVAIVYPDPVHGKIISSLRNDAMRDGLEEYELLTILGRRDPAAASQLATAVAPTTHYQSAEPRYLIEQHNALVRAAAATG